MNRFKILTNGIFKENPVLVLLLGMCPTLAVTTGAKNAIGMGLATTFVLICSNIVISLIKKVVHKSIRIPAYIVVIAGFVTLVEFILKAALPDLYDALGLYLALIVVNCIILGRAELFASKNTVLNSALDGVGMGIGFTFALLLIGSVREFFGTGCLFEIPITEGFIEPMLIFVLPAGGFFALGMVIAIYNFIMKKINGKTNNLSGGCDSCKNKCLCHGDEK